MKRLLFLIFILSFSFYANAQKPAKFKDGITTPFVQLDTLSTVQRDALVVPTGKTRAIYHKDVGFNRVEWWDGTSWEALGGTDNIYTTDGITPDGEDRFIDLGVNSDIYIRNNDYKNFIRLNDLNLQLYNGYGNLRFRTGSGGTYDSNNIGDVWTATSTVGDGEWAAQVGGGESTTVSDTAEIDLTLTGVDITADLVVGGIDVLKLDAGVQASLALADSALQSETQTAAQVTSVDTTFDVIEGTDVQANLDSVDESLLIARSTGVQFFDGLSGNGTTTINIGAGDGAILDNTDPSAADFDHVVWTATTIAAPTDLITYVYVDDLDLNGIGTVKVRNTPLTISEMKLNIYLGFITYAGGQIVASITEPTYLLQQAEQLREAFDIIGDVHEGGRLSAITTDLTVSRSDMVLKRYGVGSTSLDRHNLSVSGTSGGVMTFQHATQNGGTGTDVTVLDVGNWDNAGTIEAIPGSPNVAGIWISYTFSNGSTRILYPQTTYSSITAAEEAMSNYSPTVTAVYGNAIKTTYIVATKGATDATNSSQVQFFYTNKFGLIGGGIASAGAGYLEASNNLSDVANAVTSTQNLGVEVGVDVVSYTNPVIGGNLDANGNDIYVHEGDRVYFDSDQDVFASIFSDTGNTYGFGAKSLVLSSSSGTNGIVARNGETGALAPVRGLTFNGVALTTAGSSTDFLNAQGNYVAVTGGLTNPLTSNLNTAGYHLTENGSTGILIRGFANDVLFDGVNGITSNNYIRLQNAGSSTNYGSLIGSQLSGRSDWYLPNVGFTGTPENFFAFSVDNVKADSNGNIDLPEGIEISSIITTSRTALLADADGMNVSTSASDVTITIPLNSSVAFPIGTLLTYLPTNTGDIIIAYAGGVTGDATQTYKQNEAVTIWKTATDTWEAINKNIPFTLTTTGSSGASTYDGETLNIPQYSGGSGDVTKVGTPVNNQLGVWTGDGTIEGDSNLTWDGTDLVINGGDASTETYVDNAVATNTATGTTIDMSSKYQDNFSAASSATTFTMVNIALGGYAEVLINGGTEPTVTGATKFPNTASHIASTDMILCVKDFNGTRKFWFVEF